MSIHTLYDVPILQANNEVTNLSDYRGQVLLIVNVASRCGFTQQYSALEKLHQSYPGQLAVLGFPCNQFGEQEPGSNEEIKHFASSCFRVTFPLFAKIEVKGKNQCPLYKYLETYIQKKPWFFFIPWNFTKILVDKEGRILRRFLPFTSFKTIEKAIAQQISKNNEGPIIVK
jgi:glutathione peroxidase